MFNSSSIETKSWWSDYTKCSHKSQGKLSLGNLERKWKRGKSKNTLHQEMKRWIATVNNWKWLTRIGLNEECWWTTYPRPRGLTGVSMYIYIFSYRDELNDNSLTFNITCQIHITSSNTDKTIIYKCITQYFGMKFSFILRNN